MELPNWIYESFDNWQALTKRNVSPGRENVASLNCASCQIVRENLLPSCLSGAELLWLVDVRTLKSAVNSQDTKLRCGFCSDIYQALWTWQSGDYRLRSQLWTQEDDSPETAESWKAHAVQLPRVWNAMWQELKRSGALSHFPTDTYDHMNCEAGQCVFCKQDKPGRIAFDSVEQLCEVCRTELQKHRTGDHEIALRPVLPLFLKLILPSDGSLLTTLQVRHAGNASIGAPGGARPYREWKVYTHAGNPAAAFIPGFARESYNHDIVYAQIKTWLLSCQTQHGECQARGSSKPALPTRVLHIANDGVRLLTSDGTRGDYLALSYRWGAEQPNRLLLANKSDYERSIDVGILPQTVKEALFVTHRLGLQYLWVDSMCIIQDDVADQVREIAAMGAIYSAALLTICATKSKSCNEGFLNVSDVPGSSELLTDVGTVYPCSLPDGGIGEIRVVDRAEYRGSSEALHSRGWTLQEALLSPRLLKFGACLSWECNHESFFRTATSLMMGTAKSADLPGLFKWHEDTSERMRKVLIHLSDSLNTQRAGSLTAAIPSREPCPAIEMERLRDKSPLEIIKRCSCQNGSFWAAWKYVVEEFSKRLLSEPDDKLPALAGIAAMFQQTTHDRYLAGLWESRLLHDLMWEASPPARQGSGKRNPWRRMAWRSPSWSWASLDAQIGVIGPHKRVLNCQLSAAKLVSQRETSRVVSCDVDLVHSNLLHGQVSGGSVVIIGPLMKAKLQRGRLQCYIKIDGFCLSPAVSQTTFLEQDEFARPSLDLGFGGADEPPDVAEGVENEVWCLQMREETVWVRSMGGLKETNATALDGLILVPIDRSMTNFRRIGVWVTKYTAVVGEEQHPFANCESTELKII